VAKAAALECPNCGCVLPGGASASGKCPNCGFAMRPELPQAPKPPEPKRSVFNPRSYFHYPAENAAPKPKEAEKPKSRLRMAAESLFWILLISALLMGSGYLAMKFDMLGVKSALRTASNSEETEESIKGSFSDFRLWLKHVASVFVDQFPDGASPASTGSEGQSR
jgi:hypothetical protein